MHYHTLSDVVSPSSRPIDPIPRSHSLSVFLINIQRHTRQKSDYRHITAIILHLESPPMPIFIDDTDHQIHRVAGVDEDLETEPTDALHDGAEPDSSPASQDWRTTYPVHTPSDFARPTKSLRGHTAKGPFQNSPPSYPRPCSRNDSGPRSSVDIRPRGLARKPFVAPMGLLQGVARGAVAHRLNRQIRTWILPWGRK